MTTEQLVALLREHPATAIDAVKAANVAGPRTSLDRGEQGARGSGLGVAGEGGSTMNRDQLFGYCPSTVIQAALGAPRPPRPRDVYGELARELKCSRAVAKRLTWRTYYSSVAPTDG